jgi:hypothetical protein
LRKFVNACFTFERKEAS